MALIIDLKPQERIIIGGALITNDANRTRLHIEGESPILREKDIMREADANSPCKRIYFTIQLMYLSSEPEKLHEVYFQQIRDIQNAAPSTATFFMVINDHILANRYYKAMKEARNLMEHERELLASV
ncbi:MAG: flagellar biosynthesis repressor FlbT [Alphaproteobacteria bacterium]|nr:flagellar biosynthesis repressor FlbT [Alphaproteobacteria bacterium]